MEESGGRGRPLAAQRWIVDPLDGTTNFLHGLPHWAISIALEQHGEITAGIVYDPCATSCSPPSGPGAYLNDRRLRVSGAATCGGADRLRPADPELEGPREGFTRQMDRVADECAGLRRLGVAALDLA